VFYVEVFRVRSVAGKVGLDLRLRHCLLLLYPAPALTALESGQAGKNIIQLDGVGRHMHDFGPHALPHVVL